ncbi:MAG: bifunctional precorrin-2 dehydrogenase/sirohydrochlorin ferrochelatase [Syntrophobacterales bacterium]|nr:bifunctional precorrin-2 dehydrogenase/sirohydrochlorin ferrochelatase [Syntrophobacterales bacterium]
MYPVLLKLQGLRCLVVGGGQVGERKAKGLVEEGALVYLISREVTEWFKKMVEAGHITWLAKEYRESYMEGMALVFAATSDRELNSLVVYDALRRGLWCNSATNPSEGNMILPAVLKRGRLTISVGTDGARPALAQLVRDSLASNFNADWDQALECLDRLRRAIQEAVGRDEEKLGLFRELARVIFEGLKGKKNIEELKERVERVLTSKFSGEELLWLKRELHRC